MSEENLVENYMPARMHSTNILSNWEQFKRELEAEGYDTT
jgi:hypothetical protein